MYIYIFVGSGLITELSLLKVFKTKERRGIVERMVDDYTLIGRSVDKFCVG